MRISMRTEGGDTVLAGSGEGRSFLARMIEVTGKEPSEPEPLILDFAEIEIATSSYLREAVVRLRDMFRGKRSNFYPIVANATDAVTEELAMLLNDHSDALLACSVDDAGQLSAVEPIGKLEGVLRRTFDLVREHGEIGAVEARTMFPAETETVTAWNNRFSALADRGLVVEFNRGRLKRYKTILGGI